MASTEEHLGTEELDKVTIVMPPDLSNEGMTTAEIIEAFCFSVLFVVILTGNLLTMAAIIKCRWLHTKNNILIFSLAMADLLVGLPCITGLINRLFPTAIGPQAQFILGGVGVAAIYTSTFHLVVVAVDRFLAIVFPMRYNSHVTESTLRVFALIGWVAGVLVTMPTYVTMHFQMQGKALGVNIREVFGGITVGCYAFNFTTMALTHGKVTLEARRQLARIGDIQAPAPAAATEQPKDEATENEEGIESPGGGNRQASGANVTIVPGTSRKKGRSFGKLDKATKMMMIVMLVYLTCWGPFLIYLFVTWGYLIVPPRYQTFAAFSSIVGYSNSGMNIFVYGFSSQKFRLGYATILGIKKSEAGDLSATTDMGMSVAGSIQRPGE